MSMKLSICIPTYNRQSYLKEAIESIASQNCEDIEIVISDNASTDGTENMVKELQEKYNNIVYSKANENMGADNNYLRVVSLASGEYCWFLGSDDALANGALHRMLEEIELQFDVYLVNRIECNMTLKPLNMRYWLTEGVGYGSYCLSKREEFLDYLDKSTSLGAVYSYLSSIIFRREKWNKINFDKSFNGTAYAHVFMLLSFLNLGCNLKYVEKHLVYCRLGNDGFLNNGLYRRAMLDLDGYYLISEKLMKSDKLVKKSFLGILLKNIRVRQFIHYRAVFSQDEYNNFIDFFIEKCELSNLKLQFAKNLNKAVCSLIWRFYLLIKS